MKAIDCKEKADGVREGYKNLILNASPEDLLALAKNSVGVGAIVWTEDEVEVKFTVGGTSSGSRDADQVDLYLETPMHGLPIANKEFFIDIQGCIQWMEEREITSLNLRGLSCDLPRSEMDREIEALLFSSPDVVRTLKSEMIFELSDLLEDLPDLIQWNLENYAELSHPVFGSQ